MKKTPGLLCLLLASFFCPAQSTDSVNAPRVWFSADRSELTPDGWSDLSLYKHDAISESPFGLPSSYGVINFNRALLFDGIDDYLKVPLSLDGLAELSVLAVYQSSDTTERGIWGAEETARKVLLTTRRAVGPDTIADVYGKNENMTVLNSVVQNWDDAGVSVAGGFMALGSAGKTKNYKPFKG